MNYGIAFTPLVPSLVLWLAVAAIVVIAALLLLGRSRGAVVRVAALALIALALANPSFTREDREPLSSVAAVVIDKSPSQNFGNRTKETAAAREAGDQNNLGYYITASLVLPVWDWGALRSKLHQAQLRQTQAQVELLAAQRARV